MNHTIIHFEIPASDVKKLKEFYGSLFGWKIEKMPGPTEYYILQTVPIDNKGRPTGPGVNGGLFPRKLSAMPDQAKPMNYIAVESVDDYSKKVEKLGGRIVVPKMEIPSVGWWALALDPEGNQFGLLEPVMKDA